MALSDVAGMLEQREFFEMPLIRDVRRDCGPELRTLRKQGFVSEDDDAPIGYRVRPQAFLWWMADEVVRMVREEKSIEEWLRQQELGVVLTEGEKDQLSKAIRTVGGMLEDGAITLIEAAARGAGEALVGG